MTKMRKAVLAGALVVILIVSSMAVTLAYLTDRSEVTNVLNIGDVKIKLLPEPSTPGEPIESGELTTSPLISNPKVANIGTNDAFIKVELSVSDSSLLQFLDIKQTSADWTSIASTSFFTTGKATLYYQKVLPKKAPSASAPITADIFDSIKLKANYLEGIADSLEIYIKATAIQTGFNGSQASSAEAAFAIFESATP